jgi:hypothetical protein
MSLLRINVKKYLAALNMGWQQLTKHGYISTNTTIHIAFRRSEVLI